MVSMPNRVLVLSYSPFSSQNALTYLKHRGWNVRLSQSLKSVLPDVLKNNFDFIFVSVQFESQVIAVIQELHRTYSKSELIFFSEDGEIKSIQKLNSIETFPRVYPPVSGPSFDRCLNGIINHRRKPEEIRARFHTLLQNAFLHLIRNEKSDHEDLSDRTHMLIGSVKELTCVLVTSDRFSGYVITARAFNKDTEAHFLEDLLQHIKPLMDDSTGPYDLGEIVTVPITNVDLRSWMESESEYCQFDFLDGEEVAIAFLPTNAKDFKRFIEFDHSMLKITVDELIENMQMPSDLYIYLPKNNKFIRYVKQGDSLRSSNIEFLFLKKSDQKYWSAQFASDFLKSSLENYQQSANHPNLRFA